MSSFGGVSGLPGSGSIPRRLLFHVGRSIPGRLLYQAGSIPASPLEGTGGELGVPVPSTSQPVPLLDRNALVIMVALICALISAVSFFSMLRCALQCGRSAFRSPQAASTRRCNTGMKKAAINALPTVTYCKELQPPEAGTDCPICLAEFEDGEQLRTLPQCNHCFHIQCIDRWFRSHSSCPTCRNCLLDQAKAKAATPSNNSQSGQVCESSGAQIPRAECLAQVAAHVAPPACQGDRDGESFKDDKSGMGCWNSGKASCHIECGIGR